MLSLKRCDGIWTTQQSLTLHQWTGQQSPTSVASSRISNWVATDVGDCCPVHWCRVRDCCVVQIPSHRFSDSIHPYMQLVSVLCSQVSSIPTSLSFFLKFLSLFASFFNFAYCAGTCAVAQTNNGMCNHLSLCGIAVWFNSFLEKSGCSQDIKSRWGMDLCAQDKMAAWLVGSWELLQIIYKE